MSTRPTRNPDIEPATLPYKRLPQQGIYLSTHRPINLSADDYEAPKGEPSWAEVAFWSALCILIAAPFAYLIAVLP